MYICQNTMIRIEIIIHNVKGLSHKKVHEPSLINRDLRRFSSIKPPRTKAKIDQCQLTAKFHSIPNLKLLPPLDYFSFQRLVQGSRAILTDSGGIQEESTFRQIPCITLRPNTERPVTCDIGTNQLIGLNLEAILRALDNPKQGKIPPLWDGYSTERVIQQILSL